VSLQRLIDENEESDDGSFTVFNKQGQLLRNISQDFIEFVCIHSNPRNKWLLRLINLINYFVIIEDLCVVKTFVDTDPINGISSTRSPTDQQQHYDLFLASVRYFINK
jgi:hypothetical protein